MVDWAAARQMTVRKVSAVFDGRPCTLRPRRDGVSVNHGRQDDSSRDPFDFVCTIDEQPSGDLLGRHRGGDPGSRDANPYFDAVLTANTEAWPYLPRKGDLVLDGELVWQLAAEAADGGVRKAFYLTKG